MSSTEPTGSPNGANGSAPAGGAGEPGFRVLVQYIRDMSFENPLAPRSLASAPDQKAPDVGINVDVRTQSMGQDVYECVLTIEATSKRGDDTLYLAELQYAGLFQVANIPADAIQGIMVVEAPRYLFPFARRVLADMTRDGGFLPLMLEPVDFAALYRHQQQNAGQPNPGPGAPQVG